MAEGIRSLNEIDFQTVFDASLDACFIRRHDGQILAANRTAVDLYGYSTNELINMNVADLAAKQIKHELPRKLENLQTSADVFEWKHRRKDGSEFPVEIYVQPIIFYNQSVAFSSVRDISQRKKLEQDLQEQRHFLQQILDTEPGIVYIHNLIEGKNVYVNRHWLSAYGYSPKETQEMGSALYDLFHLDDLDRIKANHTALRQASKGEMLDIEYRVRDKQGDWHWILGRETPFAFDEKGTVTRILGIAHDITDRKQAELLREVQQSLLEMVARGKPLSETLEALVNFIEEQSPGMLGSILLLDDDGLHVRHGAAPSLPLDYAAALDGEPIGPNAGSCGTAAYRKEAVFVEDIAVDPLWEIYKAAALPYGLRACWSTPIMDARSNVLGPFAMYYMEPGLPNQQHLQLIDTATHVASIAIARHKSEQALYESRSRLMKAQQVSHLGFLEWNLRTNQIFCSDEVYKLYGIERTETYTTPEFVSKYIHPEDLEYVREKLELAVSGEKEYAIDHRIQRPDGSVVWVHAQAELIKGEGKKDDVLLGTVIDITQRKLAETRVLRMSQLYAALSQCNQAIIHCKYEEQLFPQICQDAVHYGGMKMAWIGIVNQATQRVEPVAAYGSGIEYLQGIKISLSADEPTGRGPTGTCIRENQPFWCQDFQHDSATSAWHERGAMYGWASSASLPLQRKGVPVGAITLYLDEINAFDEPVKNLLLEMMMDISFALDRFDNEVERIQTSVALKKSEQYLRTIIETEPECVKVLDASGDLIEMNPAGLAMLEASSIEQAKQHRLVEFVLPQHRDAFFNMHAQVMQGEEAKLAFEIVGLKGTRRWLETHATPMHDEEGKVTSLLGITIDITERRKNEERIKYLANFDALTGLPNRVQLDDHLKYALSLAKRSHEQLALMFIDLDRFKDVNDTLGHSSGDVLLVEIAERLRQTLREEDTASRLGGDEFILVIPNCDTQGAARVAQKILEVISVPFRIEQYDLTMSASIGIAMFPEDGVDLESLSKSADTAMYRAKQEGRSSYRFFTAAMQANATRNMQMVIALRQALEQEQFEIHYQPQISIADGRVIGVEALLRWQHPELGPVSPAEFIPVAEESGLILPIGEWVLRRAARQLKSWMNRGFSTMMMAVNLSAGQFRHPRLTEIVTQILEEERLPPQCLELELTEGVSMYDPEAAISIINGLHEAGIRLSIDDFGTGYSSLSYLKKFKVYKLKIDQSFVRDISTDQEDKAIVAAIISMSKDLGLQTIAEGVETAEQLDYLRAQGCDEAQGYFYSRPLPPEEIEPLLTNGTDTEN